MPRRRRRARKHVDFLNEHRHRYEELLEEQGGVCGICGRPPNPKRKFDLDHDHKEMFIRGLLCPRCNRAIPSWMDAAWMVKAAIYLIKARIREHAI